MARLEFKEAVEKRLSPEKKNFAGAIRISYVGDLILLKDQVLTAHNIERDKYDFDHMFEHVKPYFAEADLTVGVFEGPTAGGKTGYSSSNYGDGFPVYLNFPDDFAQTVKDAGINLVTTATNHLLDKGKAGAMRTLDVLDEVGLMHTGSYRTQEEKDKLLVVEVKGIKIAVLSYLSSVNHYKATKIVEEMPFITSIVPSITNVYHDRLFAEIEADFQKAKESGADLIMVMVHMGTQFIHQTNQFQKRWNRIFADLGADIILGDHSHAVQPIEYIGNTVVVNSPGNFANSYISCDGDATAVAEIYIDRERKKVIGTSIVPMYTQEMRKGYFRALPIYTAMTSKNLFNQFFAHEIERIKEVQKLITKVMVGKEVSVDNLQRRYYFVDNEFYLENQEFEQYCERLLYQQIEQAKSITFIGDSITEGTRNNFHPWYEPIMDCFEEKDIYNISKGSYTSKMILQEFRDDIVQSKSDLYVIAIGIDDVRCRNEKKCAMTPDEYVEKIGEIVGLARSANPAADIVLISPWTTLKNDGISRLKHEEKLKVINEYSEALNRYAQENGCHHIDANPFLRKFFAKTNSSVYMRDGVHPNATLGIELYSRAVLESSPIVEKM